MHTSASREAHAHDDQIVEELGDHFTASALAMSLGIQVNGKQYWEELERITEHRGVLPDFRRCKGRSTRLLERTQDEDARRLAISMIDAISRWKPEQSGQFRVFAAERADTSSSSSSMTATPTPDLSPGETGNVKKKRSFRNLFKRSAAE